MTKHSFKLWNSVKVEYMKTCGEYSLELLSEAVLMNTHISAMTYVMRLFSVWSCQTLSD